MRTVIFDLDGTLADTSGDLLAAANACFEARGLGALLTAADAGTALRGGRAMLRLGFSRVEGFGEAEVEEDYHSLITYYGAAIDHHTTLYSGVMEAVDELTARGCRVGICTNKPERLAEMLMTRLGVRGAFGSLIGADTLPVSKPDPRPFTEAVTRAGGNPARALLVGDSMTDERTARAAGVPSVSVSFSPDASSREEMSPDAWLDDYADLPDLTFKLLP